MQYAQLNTDDTYSHQITTNGNVEWDANNFCTAEALVRDGKAAQFSVVELLETDAPEIDPLTQSVMRDGGELVDGQWQYKWIVTNLTAEQIAANQLAAEIRNREQLKAERNAAVTAIKVTTAAGNTFDGDEVSQTRMTRAVVALGAAPAGTTVNWVLSDNSVIDATEAELTEALLRAGEAQASIWVIP